MIIAIIVLGVLLAGATAFIFWLLKVLKNTLNITGDLLNMVENKPVRRLKKAYNDKYYPATVIAQVRFNSPSDGKIVDFSRYESHKLVGYTIYTTDKMEDYYGKDFLEELDEEDIEELQKPVVIKDVLVYEIAEGEWVWKSQD